MKHLLIFLLLTFFTIKGHSQADSAQVDTVQLTMLWSQCSFCSPQTDFGFATFRNKGTKEKPDVELIGYLDQNLRPLKSQAIVWMVNIPKKRKE